MHYHLSIKLCTDKYFKIKTLIHEGKSVKLTHPVDHSVVPTYLKSTGKVKFNLGI